MIPTKLQSGQPFKDSAVKTINQIIDYLKTQRLSGDNQSIKINQNTSGITISCINNGTGKNGSQKIKYPFKLSVITENDSDFLSVQNGRIQINDQAQNRCYIQDQKISLDKLSDQGEYHVILLMVYNPLFNGDSLNPVYTPYIYFVKSDSLTNNVPCSRGVFSIPLGTVKVTAENEHKQYTVTNEILGNFVVSYAGLKTPFAIFAKTSIDNGSVKNNWILSDFSFFVMQGAVKIGDDIIYTADTNISVSADSSIYCSVNEKEKSAVIITENDLAFYDKENKIYNYRIGSIRYDNGGGLWIEQYIDSLIYANSDTYKVKVTQQDQPDYLGNKFQFHSAMGDDDYPNLSLIGGKQETTDNQGVITTKIKPYFMYHKINGYDKSKKQKLLNTSGSLMWKTQDDQQVKVIGSLANHVQISQGLEGKEVKWKADQQVSSDTGNFVFQKQNGNLSLWNGGKSENALQAVMLWDYSNGIPNVSTPPQATAENSKYVLTGTAKGGVSWGIVDSDFLDTYTVKSNENDCFPAYLQDKLSSQNNSINIGFIEVPNPENQQEIGVTTTININPSYFTSSDSTVKITDNNTSLDFRVQGLYKVKINQDDNQPDYLQNKIEVSAPLKLESVNGKLKISLNLPEGDGVLAIQNGQLKIIPIGNCQE